MRARCLLVAAISFAAAYPAFAQFASEQDRRDARRYYRAGQELLSAEQFEKAAEAFQNSIDKDPLFTLAHYGLGQANMNLRRFASAIRAFSNCRQAYMRLHGLQESQRVLVERQRDDELRELKDTLRRMRAQSGAGGMNLRIHKVESQIQDLERQRTSVTATFVSPPEVSLALGSAHFRNGDLEQAESEWKAAIAADSKMGEAHNNLAALYAMTGRKKEAEASIKAAERSGYRVNPKLKEDIKRMSTT